MENSSAILWTDQLAIPRHATSGQPFLTQIGGHRVTLETGRDISCQVLWASLSVSCVMTKWLRKSCRSFVLAVSNWADFSASERRVSSDIYKAYHPLISQYETGKGQDDYESSCRTWDIVFPLNSAGFQLKSGHFSFWVAKASISGSWLLVSHLGRRD